MDVMNFMTSAVTRFHMVGKTASSTFSITMDYVKPHHACNPPSACPGQVLSAPDVIMTVTTIGLLLFALQIEIMFLKNKLLLGKDIFYFLPCCAS